MCKQCNVRYTVDKNRRKREYAIHKLGGKCIICGYAQYSCALDVHHRDPRIKDKNFRTFSGWSEERIDRELEHCVLLCSNCHRAFHSGMIIDDRLIL